MVVINRNNTQAGIHWLRGPIEDFTIKVHLHPYQPVTSTRLLTSETPDSSSTYSIIKSDGQEYEFKWQEKMFSSWALQYYSKSYNCTSENEQRYFSEISNGNIESSLVFTYVDDDKMRPEELKYFVHSSTFSESLEKGLDKIILSNSEPEIYSKQGSKGSRSASNDWIFMHIMIDLTPRNSTPEQENEAVLVTLKWNPITKCLIVKPDFNDIEFSPYTIDGDSCSYRYAFKILKTKNEDDLNKRQQLMKIINKLHTKVAKRLENEVNFYLTPEGRCRYFVSIILENAKDFESENIHLEYSIHMPDELCCISGCLEGRTHSSQIGRNKNYNFSHAVEFVFEAARDESSTKCPRLFVEAISRDSWNRLRTEGYGYFDIDLNLLGHRNVDTCCVRPQQSESERYFIGGARLIADVTQLAIPRGHQGNRLVKLGVQTITTGSVHATFDIAKQARKPFNYKDDFEELSGKEEQMSSKGLFRSVNTVLREYRRARTRLRKCRERYDAGEGTSKDFEQYY